MTLKEYLTQPGQTATELARKCGVSIAAISRAANGHTQPSVPLMREITRHTRKAVTFDQADAIEAERAA